MRVVDDHHIARMKGGPEFLHVHVPARQEPNGATAIPITSSEDAEKMGFADAATPRENGRAYPVVSDDRLDGDGWGPLQHLW